MRENADVTPHAIGLHHGRSWAVQVRLARRLAVARSAVEDIRRDFGDIRIEDPKKLPITRISEHEYKLRIAVTLRDRNFVHLTETEATMDTIPIVRQPLIATVR